MSSIKDYDAQWLRDFEIKEDYFSADCSESDRCWSPHSHEESRSQAMKPILRVRKRSGSKYMKEPSSTQSLDCMPLIDSSSPDGSWRSGSIESSSPDGSWISGSKQFQVHLYNFLQMIFSPVFHLVAKGYTQDTPERNWDTCRNNDRYEERFNSGVQETILASV